MMNTFLYGFLSIFVLSALLKWGLDRLNIMNLKRCGADVPACFAGEIEGETLTRMRDYTVASSRFGSFTRLFNAAFVLFILFSGMLPMFTGWIESLELGFILSGLIFFFGFSLLSGILGIPFDLYDTFVIERRFNFSTITWKIWLTDLIKSTLVSIILMGIFLSVFLLLIDKNPTSWWIWVWLFYVSFQLLLVWLYPVVIAPLFNKFEPIEDEELKSGITDLATKVGMQLKGIFKMDAGTRSKHSNAYFTGIGKTKRIVLFDTLINNHDLDEVIAVLAHELGHFKLGHIRKQLGLGLVVSLAALYLMQLVLSGDLLYESFGVQPGLTYAGLLIFGLVIKPLALFVAPLGVMLSRRFERQADRFAFDLTGSSEPLIRALKKLAKDNLSNLHPHPLYAWWYYSHPPIVERVERLKSLQ